MVDIDTKSKRDVLSLKSLLDTFTYLFKPVHINTHAYTERERECVWGGGETKRKRKI